MSHRPGPTEQQKRALDTRAMAVALEAGAGCGKTFVLTERLLAHLDPTSAAPADAKQAAAVEEVVAITFTEAAAREMRDRIRRKCLDRMQSSSGETAAAWLRLLRSLDAARVSTIHAFCGALLRTHAVEMGLDPSFAVIDQASADVLLSETIDARLREGLDRQEEPVVALAAEYEIQGFRKRLKGFLAGPIDTAAEWVDRSPSELAAVWRDVYERQLVAEHLTELAEEPQIDTLCQLLHAVNEPTPAFAKKQLALLDLLPQVREGGADLDLLTRLRQSLVFSGKLPKRYWEADDSVPRFRAAVEAIRGKIDSLKPLADDDALHHAADLGLAFLRQASQVAKSYTEAKRAAGALDYDDLLREAHRLLTSPEHAATQRQLRRQVRLLLVDEFQDTDSLQADLVRALVGLNANAKDTDTNGSDTNGSEPTNGRLFFVGDFKQSIYRFRGAEPAVFRHLQDAAPEEGRLSLSINFRSQPGVIDFVNHLFAEPFGQRYTPLAANRPQATELPAVELLITTPPDEKASAEQKRKSEAAAIARRLRELFEGDDRRVVDEATGEARVARPGDVAILFQALSDVQHYEQALRDEGIEYYLVGGHAFYSQQEVYDILHLLRAIASRCDEVSLAGVLRSPMFALEDETLYWMRQASGSLNGSIASRLTPSELTTSEAEKLHRARATLHELREMKGRASTVEVLTLAIERTGYDATLLADFLGERKLANLDKLLEQARASDNAASSGTTIGGGDAIERFARQLGEFTLAQSKEALASITTEDAGVVRLMTVHHSKGLEFPLVVLPDIGRKSRPDTDAAVFDFNLGPLVKPTAESNAMVGLDLYKRLAQPEERAEMLRKFYVACTRAADRLLMSAVITSSEKLEGEWLGVLAERYDLETGEPLQPASENAPAMQVSTGDPTPAKPKQQKRRGDRLAMLEAARAGLGDSVAASSLTRPLPINPDHLRQFSVSRLTGKLHRGRERTEALAVQQALQNKRETIDPRGLGTLVHAVLERLPPGVATAGEQVATLCAALAPLHLRRQIDQAADEATKMVEKFLASPVWKSFGEAKRFEQEVEFVLGWPASDAIGGEAYLRGYIDALVEDADGRWWVVDFKTNRVDAAGVPKAAEPYQLQLGVYAMAVEKVLGQQPAGTRLCFLRPGVTLEAEWNAAARQATIDRVNQAIAAVRAEVRDE